MTVRAARSVRTARSGAPSAAHGPLTMSRSPPSSPGAGQAALCRVLCVTVDGWAGCDGGGVGCHMAGAGAAGPVGEGGPVSDVQSTYQG